MLKSECRQLVSNECLHLTWKTLSLNSNKKDVLAKLLGNIIDNKYDVIAKASTNKIISKIFWKKWKYFDWFYCNGGITRKPQWTHPITVLQIIFTLHSRSFQFIYSSCCSSCCCCCCCCKKAKDEQAMKLTITVTYVFIWFSD